MFSREDWTLFTALPTLAQKAGVAEELIPHLILKELVDNALDAGANVEIDELEGGGYYVQDDGPGIQGTPEEVAEIFSLRRPLISSKLLRLPTRGALGNGLRVVTGAVVATGGELHVSTCGRRLRLDPGDDGITRATVEGPYSRAGTRVEVRLGKGLLDDDHVSVWAEQALRLARHGTAYTGRSSPFWYTSEAFHALCQAAGSLTVRALVAELDGCSGAKAGNITARFKNRLASTLDRSEVDALLASARTHARPVRPARLGSIGAVPSLGAHARTSGTFALQPARGSHAAEIPFVVEAWVRPALERSVFVHVNRTPVTTVVHAFQSPRRRTDTQLLGCTLNVSFTSGRAPVTVLLNVTSPHVAITSDSKAPDLAPMEDQICATVTKAARKAKREHAPGITKSSQKEAALDALEDAVAKVSGGGSYRFSVRQLFYAVRPRVKEETGMELLYGNFEKILTDHERDAEPISGLYRDERGVLYHPHTGDTVPIGTLSVEAYERPPWTFRNILYLEKEGFFPILKDARWPERHDCALLTSKGFASRAARDLLDLLDDDADEPVTIYCVHDADGPGTKIHEALQEGTAARPGRAARIINLGLEPDEAIEMNLEVETIERKGAVPVARYVAPEWRDWLQSHRVELNAMSTPQFLEWLDRKIAPHEDGKLIPPADVLEQRFREAVEGHVRKDLVEAVLRKAKVDDRVKRSLKAKEPEVKDVLKSLADRVERELLGVRERHWALPVEAEAKKLLNKRSRSPSRRRKKK